MEAISMADTVLITSRKEYCLTADKIPIGIPIRMTSAMLVNASLRVTGNLTKISSKTGRPVRYEVPKSP